MLSCHRGGLWLIMTSYIRGWLSGCLILWGLFRMNLSLSYLTDMTACIYWYGKVSFYLKIFLLHHRFARFSSNHSFLWKFSCIVNSLWRNKVCVMKVEWLKFCNLVNLLTMQTSVEVHPGSDGARIFVKVLSLSNSLICCNARSSEKISWLEQCKLFHYTHTHFVGQQPKETRMQWKKNFCKS